MGHLHNEVHKAPRPRGCWIYSCPCGSTVAAPGKENLRKRLTLSNCRAPVPHDINETDMGCDVREEKKSSLWEKVP